LSERLRIKTFCENKNIQCLRTASCPRDANLKNGSR
jgi:hypothetical protein